METLNNIIHKFLFALASALYFVAFWVLGLFLREKDVIISFIILMYCDIFLGIWSSIKQGRTIKSSIMLQGVGFKMFMLFITSFIALILKYYAQVDIFKPLILIGAFIEFKSITEHIKIIWGIDVAKRLYQHIKNILHIKKEIKKMSDDDYYPTDEA